jgi:hypothetical protein
VRPPRCRGGGVRGGSALQQRHGAQLSPRRMPHQ